MVVRLVAGRQRPRVMFQEMPKRDTISRHLNGEVERQEKEIKYK